MTLEEREQRAGLAWLQQNSQVAMLLTDIMQRTRAAGMCVEAYF